MQHYELWQGRFNEKFGLGSSFGCDQTCKNSCLFAIVKLVLNLATGGRISQLLILNSRVQIQLAASASSRGDQIQNNHDHEFDLKSDLDV